MRDNATAFEAAEAKLKPRTSLSGDLQALWRLRRDRAAVADAVHDTLHEAIASGVLGPGTRLGEEGLAREFSVSRTPVREAVLRLEAERLAERRPRGGLAVSPISAEEILELYAVREVLDGLAAKLAAESSRSVDIALLRTTNGRLRAASVRGDIAETARLNLEFHGTIASVSRNQVLGHFVNQVQTRVRRFPGTTFSDPDRARAAVEEHEGMIDAIAARDGSRAELLARDHMRRAMEIRMAMLQDTYNQTGQGNVRR